MLNRKQHRAAARAALEFIKAHPEKHDQSNWIEGTRDATGCGTSMCVAGTINWQVNGRRARVWDSANVARDALGLTVPEGQVLFYEFDNDRAIAKLEKVALGIPFDKEDFHVWEDPNEDGEGELTFMAEYWADQQESERKA